jgi:hypothetical protein
VQVNDLYRGVNSQVQYYQNPAPDYLAIPADQTNNYWVVVFSFVTNFPGLGKRKVLLLDRWGTPGDSSILV